MYRGLGTRRPRFKWCVTAFARKAGLRLEDSFYREGVEPFELCREGSIRCSGFPLYAGLSWRDGYKPRLSDVTRLYYYQINNKIK